MLPGGGEAGEHLVMHPLVKKVSFTSGLATAAKILRACAETAKPAVMELGGKSANIVFERVRALVAAIKTGDPTDPTTVHAPVITQAAADRIMGMIERAIADGATLVAGGHRMDRPGFYIEPTVFTDVDPDSEIAQEEVFGPVLAITKFSSEQEAITIANSTRYGLAAYIQTRDLTRAHRVAAELEAGEVLINGAGNLAVHRPFGGIGISGVGKEGGRAGFEEFLRVNAVGIAVPADQI
jgi:aldehyde dehydrogenase (NAD+)